ncbi:HB2L protein, partial [Alcedo cyanopectus]|nr:HB2L protein [Ceyx cyanopectus]
SPDRSPAQTGVFLEMNKFECQYLNGSERVRFLHRYIHNREQYTHFDSDVGLFVADTPLGEPQAEYMNSLTEYMEQEQDYVDTFCRHNYEVATPSVVQR